MYDRISVTPINIYTFFYEYIKLFYVCMYTWVCCVALLISHLKTCNYGLPVIFSPLCEDFSRH